MSMTPQGPIRVPSKQEQAFRRTVRILTVPVIGAVAWELFMVWIENTFLTGTSSAGIAIVIGTIFGLPSMIGIYWAIWALYHHVLDGMDDEVKQAAWESRTRSRGF